MGAPDFSNAGRTKRVSRAPIRYVGRARSGAQRIRSRSKQARLSSHSNRRSIHHHLPQRANSVAFLGKFENFLRHRVLDPPNFGGLTSGRRTIQLCRMVRLNFLSPTERLEPEACVRSQREDYGIARRANALLLLDDGKSCQVIAEFLYLDDDTIRGWHKTYCESGWDALAVDGWKGGQSRMAPEKEAALCD